VVLRDMVVSRRWLWGGELSHTGEVVVYSACQEGYYLDNADRTCRVHTGCATCETSATQCTSCSGSKYLKEDTHTCVDANQCGASNYADKRTWTCKACSEITDCTACAYNDATGKPKCTACNGNKKVKTTLDGTTTCITVVSDCTDENHFKTDGNAACYLCGENTQDQTEANKGTANCKTCTKTGSAKPECTACLDGYFLDNSKTCTQQCGANCATCSVSGDANKCSTCMAGFFLVTEDANKKCVPCGDTAQGGIDGCAECDSQSGTLKCTKCKLNRRSKGESGNYTCEEKTCEDPAACGAIIVDGDGNMKYHCSQCRQQ
ncbi:Variant-specific surface protein, partial [Giardia duodenalis]